MTPERKLSIASALMITGLIPLVLGSLFGLAIVTSDGWKNGKMGMAEGLTVFIVMMVTYAFAICVSGAGALWAFILHRLNKPLRSRRASIMTRVVFITLAAPLLYIFVIN